MVSLKGITFMTYEYKDVFLDLAQAAYKLEKLVKTSEPLDSDDAWISMIEQLISQMAEQISSCQNSLIKKNKTRTCH